MGFLRVFYTLVLFSALTHAQPLGPCTIETVAGGRSFAFGDGGPAVEAELLFAADAAFAPDGAIYIADTLDNRIRRVLPDGVIETFAGNGEDLVTGDGIPALEAGLRNPDHLAFGPNGALYFADAGPVVRRIGSDGVITTIAGGKRFDFFGDGGPATDAGLVDISGLAVGPDGSIYISSDDLHRVRRIGPDGIIDTIAGGGPANRSRGGYSGDGGPATEAELDQPRAIAAASDGTVYVMDGWRRERVRRIRPDGIIETYMRTKGVAGEVGASPSEASFSTAFNNLEIDAQDRLYWSESSGRVLRIGQANGLEEAWAGPIGSANRLHVGPQGALFGLEAVQVFRLNADQEKQLIAGVGYEAAYGNGGPALEAAVNPRTLDVGFDGSIYFVHPGQVRKVHNGRIEHFAGNGQRETSGDGGPAVQAGMQPSGVAAGPDDTVFVIDGSYRVRRIDADGRIETYAGGVLKLCGSNPPLDCGDGGPATEAILSEIRQIDADSQGRLYILHNDERERRRSWIRVVEPDGTISTLPTALPGGTGVDAESITVDPEDRLIFTARMASEPIHRYFRWTAQEGFEELPLPYTLYPVQVLAADSQGNRYVRNSLREIARIAPDGFVDSIVPPQRTTDPIGDGGSARDATVTFVNALATDLQGNLYVADPQSQRVRRINDPAGCSRWTRPVVGGVAEASSGAELSPGVLFSLFGQRLGPAEPRGAQLGPDGRVTSDLGGVRVLVNGEPVPLLFVSEGQINGILPQDVETVGSYLATQFVVEREGETSRPHWESVLPTSPGLFRQGFGPFVAALNQDGSIHTRDNPAAPGEVVVLFGAGAGRTEPPGAAGAIAGSTLAMPLAEVRATIDGLPAEVLYSGSAPGLVEGVLQLNVRVPDGVSRGDIVVQVGSYQSSGAVRMAIAGHTF